MQQAYCSSSEGASLYVLYVCPTCYCHRFPVPKHLTDTIRHRKEPLEYHQSLSQEDALFYCQFVSIINLYMFRAGLLLIIRRHLSAYTAFVMCHAFMLAGCCSLTYLLTPWSRVLLEKLAGLQLVKKFPAFYETRMFLTALTSARHLFLS